MQLTQKELITVLKTTLDAIRDTLGVDITALRIETLTTIVLDPGAYLRDMETFLEVSTAAAHRNIAKLTRQRQGSGFLERRLVRDGRKYVYAIYPADEARQWLSEVAARIAKETGAKMTARRLAVIIHHTMLAIRASVDTDIALYRMKLLLCILESPGIAQAELEATAGVDPTGVSRNLANLSAFKQRKTPGPDFVYAQVNPLSRKEHHIYPTDKAKKWLADTLKRVNAKLLI